jgi:hypothetical protein
MGQASAVLRRMTNGFSHWCPGCEEMHVIYTARPNEYPNGPCWTFDGNAERPTFNPSVKITGKKTVKVNGKWTGEWVRDANGKAVDECCHYFLHEGVLKFCSDSTHALAGKNVPLPALPDFLKD